MSVELSRCLARVALQEPIATLGFPARLDIAYATERAQHFSDLPERFQSLILAAAAMREQKIAAKHAETSAIRRR